MHRHDIILGTVLKVGMWVTVGSFPSEGEWAVCRKRRGKGRGLVLENGVVHWSFCSISPLYASGVKSPVFLSVCKVLAPKRTLHPLPTLQNNEPDPEAIETGCKPVLFEMKFFGA